MAIVLARGVQGGWGEGGGVATRLRAEMVESVGNEEKKQVLFS